MNIICPGPLVFPAAVQAFPSFGLSASPDPVELSATATPQAYGGSVT